MMKWITSTQLNQWADSRDAQSMLPELVLRLIHATVSNITKLRFPSGDAVHLTGWDGVLESEDAVYTIGAGLSLWECGTNKDLKSKADSDYVKRSNNALGYDTRTATYVFVTPRIWDGAEKWMQDKNTDSIWRNVVVLTAVELEDWLALCPSVSLWLAEQWHEHPIRANSIETFWKNRFVGQEITLNPDIILGGREIEQNQLYQQLDKPSITVVQSIAQFESVAFAVACLLESADAFGWKSRSLVVNDENTLEQLIEEYDNLIFIANVGNKNHIYATQKGHRIIYAVSAAEIPKVNDLISLPLIDRDKFIKSLSSSGLNRNHAEQLSKETVRNITILRRRLKLDFTPPLWAKAENIRDLIPAILIGRWNDKVEGDRNIVARIAGESYNRYSEKLQRWVNSDDTPLVNVDGIWRIISPYESFCYASNYFTANDFTNYRSVVFEIAADNDPDANEKLNATTIQFWENKQCYSGWLKEGIFQSAILISIIGKSTELCAPQQPADMWVDSIIRDILNDSTIEWWFSNGRILSQIAEASPRCYIKYLIDDLKKEDSIIKRLFIPKANISFMGPGENYTNVLWSLRMLLWEEEFFLPVSLILMELSAIENNTNSADKPFETLCAAYTIWHPQTYVNTNQRLQTLRTLCHKYPIQGFSLCKHLVDRLDRSVIFPTKPMHWRRFEQERPKVTNEDIYESIGSICQLMVDVCNFSTSQIVDILDIADQQAIGRFNRETLLEFIIQHKERFTGNYDITNKVRSTIYHHKSYPESNWALTPDEIGKWEGLLKDIEAKNPIQKYRWMFKDSYLETLEINKAEHDFQKVHKITLEIRSQALKEIHDAKGVNGIIEFAQIVECQSIVGDVYAQLCAEDDFEIILRLTKTETKLLQFVKGFFQGYAYRFGVDQLINALKRIDVEKFMDVIHIPLTAIGASKMVWDYVETLPKKISTQYWTDVIIGIYESSDEVVFIVNQLNTVQRYEASIDLIHRSSKYHSVQIPSDVIVETIIGLLSSQPNDASRTIGYELADIIQLIDKHNDVDREKLFFIEFVFYELLKQYVDADHLKLIDEIMSNPQSLMDILNFMYLSSDPEERNAELEEVRQKKNQTYALLAYRLISDIRRVPCVDRSNKIDEKALKNYITQLRELAGAAHKLTQIDHTIGELLANYPEVGDYPPTAICEIIENLNNKEVNSGFRSRIFNKRGVTVRPALEGGTLEKAESLKYKTYANKIRFTYPVIAEIFDTLSSEYADMAYKEDTRTKIEKMEF